MASEVQLIIRFPDSLADIVNRAIAKSKECVEIKLNPDEEVLNLAEPTKAHIKFGESTYPVLIARLPCNIETHKTFDHINYFKAGDIAEMVHVFETEEERDFAHFEINQIEGYKRTFPSGITPPTTQIIRRKFLKTRSTKPEPREKVAAVEHEIQKYVLTEDIVEEFEEVVDFEEYMADASHPGGRVFTFSTSGQSVDTLAFQNHPEMLLRQSDKEFLEALAEREKKRAPPPPPPPSIVADTVVSESTSTDAVTVSMEINDVDDDDGNNDNNGNKGNSDDDDDSDDEDFLNELKSNMESN